MIEISRFELAGCELPWPIGIAAGVTNHPDVEVVARRLENYASLGVGEIVLGSLKLGEASGGNAHKRQGNGKWEYFGGDEYPELDKGIGHNSKGLPGPGVNAGLERMSDFIDLGRSKGVEVSLSVSPHTQNPLEEVPELVDAAEKALSQGVLRVEFNLSCPNIPGRPPFYMDTEAVQAFMIMAGERKDKLLNRFGHPGLYPKYGPMDDGFSESRLRSEHWIAVKNGIFGGVVTSNTVLGEGVILENGENAIEVNNGRAGMGGPFFEEEGRNQLKKWVRSEVNTRGNEIVSALGVSTGEEVLTRLRSKASICQLASVVYWPKLVGEESAGAVVEKIKGQFVDAVTQP